MTLSPKLQDALDRLVGFAILRMQEASTWRGVMLVLSACGSIVSPKYAQAIIAVGMLGSGLVGVLCPTFIKKAQEADAQDLGKVQTVDPS